MRIGWDLEASAAPKTRGFLLHTQVDHSVQDVNVAVWLEESVGVVGEHQI